MFKVIILLLTIVILAFSSTQTALAHIAQIKGCPKFHMGSPGQLAEYPIRAEAIVDALTDGCSVQIEYAVVNGSLKLLKVNNAHIDQQLTFIGVTFEDEVILQEVSVAGNSVAFKDSTFRERVLIESIGSQSLLVMNLSKSTFEKPYTMKGMNSVKLNLREATFIDTFHMQEMDSVELDFEGATFEKSLTFDTVNASSVTFRNASIKEVDWDNFTIQGELWPPASMEVMTRGLSWDFVVNTRPSNMAKQTFFGQWENLFSATGLISDAREVRTISRRSELGQIRNWLVVGFFVMVGSFSLIYWSFFRKTHPQFSHWLSRDGRFVWYGKIFILSFDISTPGVDALHSQWLKNALLEISSVPFIIILAHKFFGWAALGIGAAIITAWFIG